MGHPGRSTGGEQEPMAWVGSGMSLTVAAAGLQDAQTDFDEASLQVNAAEARW